MPLSPIQVAHQDHTLTAADVANGWSLTHIVWPAPFADVDYEIVYGVHDLDSDINSSFVTGDIHNVTEEGFDAIVYFSGGIPLTQGQLDVVNTKTPQTLAFTAPITSLYLISVYAAGSGAGTSGDTAHITVSWTDAENNFLTVGIADIIGGAVTAGNIA